MLHPTSPADVLIEPSLNSASARGATTPARSVGSPPYPNTRGRPQRDRRSTSRRLHDRAYHAPTRTDPETAISIALEAAGLDRRDYHRVPRAIRGTLVLLQGGHTNLSSRERSAVCPSATCGLSEKSHSVHVIILVSTLTGGRGGRSHVKTHVLRQIPACAHEFVLVGLREGCATLGGTRLCASPEKKAEHQRR